MRQVSPHEHGLVRVFAVNLPKAEAARINAAALGTALGVALDEAYVDIVAVSDLADVGPRGFLLEGHGVSADAMAADREKLDALDGVVVVMTSKAVQTRPATLSESADITLIGAYPLAESATAVGAFEKADVPPKSSAPAATPMPPKGGPALPVWLIVAAAVGLACVLLLIAVA